MLQQHDENRHACGPDKPDEQREKEVMGGMVVILYVLLSVVIPIACACVYGLMP